MSLIDDIRKDREAGTPGPWCAPEPTQKSVSLSGGTIFKVRHQKDDATPIIFVSGLDEDGLGEGTANARRITRVPDLEAALLAAEELARAVDAHSNEFDMRVENALTAFRAAIGESQ